MSISTCISKVKNFLHKAFSRLKNVSNKKISFDEYFSGVPEGKTNEELFTGRELFKDEVFIEHLDVLNRELENNSYTKKRHVINFYGVGGIGKTELKLELQRCIRKDNIRRKTYYCGIELSKTQKRNVQSFIENFIKSFPQYDLFFPFTIGALMHLGYKDWDITKHRKERLKDILLTIVVTLLSVVFSTYIVQLFTEETWYCYLTIGLPILGAIAKKILEYYKADKEHEFPQLLFERMRSVDKKEAARFKERHNNKSYSWELYVERYFEFELKSLTSRRKPYIFFIDTFEYTNAENEKDSFIDYNNDEILVYLIRLITTIDPVIWIISGREPIEKNIEALSEVNVDVQELLNFEDNDIKSYMSKAEIDLCLFDRFKEISKGNPFLLSLLYERYRQLKCDNSPDNPELITDNYGTDKGKLLKKLQERYFNRFSDEDGSRKLYKFLLTMDNGWTDELIEDISYEMSVATREERTQTVLKDVDSIDIGYSRKVYKRIMSLSVINKTGNIYTFHDEARDVLLKGVVESEIISNKKIYYFYLSKKIPENNEYNEKTIRMIKDLAALKLHECGDFFCDFVEEYIRNTLLMNFHLLEAKEILDSFFCTVSYGNERAKFWHNFCWFYYSVLIGAGDLVWSYRNNCYSFKYDNLKEELEKKNLLYFICSIDSKDIVDLLYPNSHYFIYLEYINGTPIESYDDVWNLYEKGRKLAENKEYKESFRTFDEAYKLSLQIDLGHQTDFSLMCLHAKIASQINSGDYEFDDLYSALKKYRDISVQTFGESSLSTISANALISQFFIKEQEKVKLDKLLLSCAVEIEKKLFEMYYTLVGPYDKLTYCRIYNIWYYSDCLGISDYDAGIMSPIHDFDLEKIIYRYNSNNNDKYLWVIADFETNTLKDYFEKHIPEFEHAQRTFNLEAYRTLNESDREELCYLYGIEAYKLFWRLKGYKTNRSNPKKKTLNLNKSLEENAFYGNNDIITANIPEGVEKIGKYAFANCSELTSVTIPSSVKRIEEDAFANCSKLTEVIIREGVTYIGKGAFSQCENIVSVIIPDSVCQIDDNAFNNCTKLSSVVLSAKLISLAGFNGCISLRAIEIPFSVREVKGFNDCPVLSDVIIPDGVSHIEKLLNRCPLITKLMIPKTVKEIVEDSFCDFLGKIEFEDGICRIPDYSCNDNKYLTEIIIPKSVTEIGANAFRNCSVLKTVNCISNNLVKIAENAFEGCGELTELNIPESVSAIGQSAFAFCIKLWKINIPHKIEDIPKKCFDHCSSLSEILLPSSIKTIGYAAFSYCTNLKEINLPDTITDIGCDAFCHCERLNMPIVIPSKIEIIKDSAFECCYQITSVKLSKSVQEICPRVFAECINLSEIISLDYIKEIGYEAFEGCSSLETVKLPSVIKIGSGLFKNCKNLLSVDIPDEIQDFGYGGTFEGCEKLQQIKLPNNLKSIEDRTFSGCRSLTSLNIPLSVTKLGDCVFADCDSLKELHIPNTICSFSHNTTSGVFSHFRGKIILDSEITTINDYEFYEAEELTELIIPKTVTSIGNFAFKGCIKISRLSIENVICIGESAFCDCFKLDNIKLAEGIRELSTRIFCNCKQLSEMIIPESVTEIGGDAFNGCSNLKQIVIPSGTDSFGTSVFGAFLGALHGFDGKVIFKGGEREDQCGELYGDGIDYDFSPEDYEDILMEEGYEDDYLI